jgi:hypothetical protein
MPDPLPIDRSLSLQHHLQFNHFPSVHSIFVPIAEAAIMLAAEAVETGDMDKLDDEIELPNGVILPVRRIMDELHLWAYITEGVDL